MANMVIIAGVRYREEDARRLGLSANVLREIDEVKTVSPTGDASEDQAPTGDAPTGDAPTDDASEDQAPTGDAPTGDASEDQAPTGDASEDQAPTGDASEDQAPGKNASRDSWVAFALAAGKTEEELASLKRDDIAALFQTS